MSQNRVFISGIGAVTPAGIGPEQLNKCFTLDKTGICPLSLFKTPQADPLPVGEIIDEINLGPDLENIPRTHKLAYIAAQQAMSQTGVSPDAVVMGITTGGLDKTEVHLKNSEYDPDLFKYHGTGTVAQFIAQKFNCKGPALTISTACSSGAAAIKLGLELLRTGQVKSVLAGGADSLCRLTYYGFDSLQIIDPKASRPLDKDRQGMSVAEGAAMLFLEACKTAPGKNAVEILGGGLSCDAYHPATPHPEGRGAFQAMKKALADAEIGLEQVDYINLHGTGTLDNDLAEAKAVLKLFKNKIPPLSSVKGMTGHSLAGAGAVEAVLCTLAISKAMLPINTGCNNPDPELNLAPVTAQTNAELKTVLSNSFGFGGNNACLVLGKVRQDIKDINHHEKKQSLLKIESYACLTGAGDTGKTFEKIVQGENCSGVLSIKEISKNLNPRAVRRLKRLPRLALSLAVAAHENSREPENPDSIFFGTGWGALSETFDFLTKLYDSGEQFTSPTDFIGSVHNAPAGQIGLHFKAQGPNITTTGGDYSFEQALLTASLLADNTEKPMIVLGTDEFHEKLTPAFDRSFSEEQSDGGAALCIKPVKPGNNSGIIIKPVFFQSSHENPGIVRSLIRALGGPKQVANKFGAVMAGIPAAFRDHGKNRLKEFIDVSGFDSCIIDYRKLTGEFASASAVAAVMAAYFLETGEIPRALSKSRKISLQDKGILILGFGDFITGIEVINYS